MSILAGLTVSGCCVPVGFLPFLAGAIRLGVVAHRVSVDAQLRCLCPQLQTPEVGLLHLLTETPHRDPSGAGWVSGAVAPWRLYDKQELAAAAKETLRLGAASFDAVKHPVLCRLEGRPPKLGLEFCPYLTRVRVSTTSAGAT